MDAMLVSDKMLICLQFFFFLCSTCHCMDNRTPKLTKRENEISVTLVTFTWNQRFCEQGPLVLRISFYTDQSKEEAIVKGT